MKDKLVSIGLPIIKSEFLKKAIESCLIQTYTNFELIIQNNAKESIVKFKIKEIIDSFDDARISYFETEKQLPMVQNWSDTLKKFNGDFCTILCDDDKWHPDFIKEMLRLAKKFPSTNIFHARVVTIDQFDNKLSLSPLCPEFESGLDFLYHRMAGFRNNYLSDFIVRTDSLRKIGGFVDLPDGWGSDDITWFKIASKGGVAYSSRELFYYRDSPVNTSNDKSIQKKLHAIDHQYKEIQKIILDSSAENSVIRNMLESQLLIFKDSRKCFLWEKRLQKKYKIPYPVAKFIAYIIRYVIRRKQRKMSQ